MRTLLFFILLVPFITLATPLQLEFLDEYIVDENLKVNGDIVGGLSSIDYANGKYLLIADDYEKPRYFEAVIKLQNNKIKHVEFQKSLALLNGSPLSVDPESLRAVPGSNAIVWSSEGSIKNKQNPAIFMKEGNKLSSFQLPTMFDISSNSGPRHNAVFEGLTLDNSGAGVWVSMEGTLKQDGEEANIKHGSMVRISYLDFASKQIQKQFAYYLAPMVNRVEAKANAFRTTGLVEILQINKYQFLTMERSYTAGIKDGGNDVSIYFIDIKSATDTTKMNALSGNEFVPAEKSLVLDLSKIKHLFGSNHIDNLEGMTFGPTLENGNPSLLMVSDNNFNIFGKQLSQILLFEVKLNESFK